MNKLRILLALGVLIAILPYLGFPYIIKNILISLSGFGVIYLSYLLREKNKTEEVKEKPTFENFSENHDFVEVESNNIDKQKSKEGNKENKQEDNQEIL